jgi:hypothetical protein
VEYEQGGKERAAYEVYRFGGREFIDTDIKTRTIGPQSEEKVLDFFEKLLKKYEVI